MHGKIFEFFYLNTMPDFSFLPKCFRKNFLILDPLAPYFFDNILPGIFSFMQDESMKRG